MSNDVALSTLRTTLAQRQASLKTLSDQHAKLRAAIEVRARELDQVAAREIQTRSQIAGLESAIAALVAIDDAAAAPGPQEARGA